ncbi:unnamed protein product [Urochloa humidicola]
MNSAIEANLSDKMVAEGWSEGEGSSEGEGAGFAKRWGRLRQENSSEEEGPDRSLAAEAMRFRDEWNALHSRCFGHFEDTTKVRNMRFTYKKPTLSESPVPTATLQIFSLKVAKISGGLQWPLHLFGKVAVRDVVDYNRNMIFDCPRESCQLLTQQDPFLKLTGPTRAVVLVDPVTLESQLVKRDYASMLSTVEFELASIVRSVEATITLRVKSGSWPDGFRARFSARTASIDTAEVILLDSRDKVCIAGEGTISLWRCVASVEISGMLEVCVKAERDEFVVSRSKLFKPKKNGASHDHLLLDFCTLDITVRWSLVSTSL